MNRSLLRSISSFLIGIIFFMSCGKEISPLQVALLFTDHMVLQQQTETPIWGKGNPGSRVTVAASWGNNVEVFVNSQGSWKAEIDTPEFGGPHQLIISSENEKILLKDVMVGEVWLASGQSNMEWPMNARINNQKQEIENAEYPQIRMFTMPRNWVGTNSDETAWKVASPESIRQFSAVGYFFARELTQNLDVPIGILNTSWGGTRVEAWTSMEQLAEMTPSKKQVQEIINQGGLSKMIENQSIINRQIDTSNNEFLGAPSFSIPERVADWRLLTLNDMEYADPEFDDSGWNSFEASGNDGEEITFEEFFEPGTLAENGVVWLRKSFDLSDFSSPYSFVVDGGIDDFDYTYLNGTLIGSGFSCCTSRSYSIPEGLLKKEGNVLAIRIIDTGGLGGFRSSAYLESANEKLQLDQGNWQIKHHAFYLETSIQLHKFNFGDLIQNMDVISAQVKKGLSPNDPNRYSVLFETMVKPLIPFKFKGALWYQGESNVANHQDYKTLFTGMIADWRAQWESDFPFYFVQIAPYEYVPEALSQSLRDAQRKTLSLERTGMAITLDIGEEKDIHPANKQDVGLRLARLALHYDYGQKDIVPTGPLYKSQTLYPAYIDLSFDHVGSGLEGKNDLSGFEIAASDRSFAPATATIIGDQIRVSSLKVKNPKHVRYGWKNYFEATLFNQEGLPASSFETP
jgi:sialate O-acetylesterase